ncbi:Transposase [Flavimaricola marinus]|uniref:Transposase n=1 Tax=Flavimaricola marinus TaxID=1819565 RepID=A0A238LHF4_9RHOB|nr:Transposase [Flavimaricola marinus]
MSDVAFIGLDLANQVFQLHELKTDGSFSFRLKLPRSRVLDFFASQQRSVVAMQVCTSAHSWEREIAKLGHSVRLITPINVKPFVKPQMNDAGDAEAIAEAASRPTLRFVAVKSLEQQARAMLFRTRDLLVRQRTQLINAQRGHLAEHGVVAPTGAAYLNRLAEAVSDDKAALPEPVREPGTLYLEQIEALSARVVGLHQQMRKLTSSSGYRPCQGLGRSRRWRPRPSRRP